MKTWIKILMVTVVVAIPAFLLEPRGLLGGFWAPHPEIPAPPGNLVPFFMMLGLFDALSLGAAVSFLIFGYPLIAAIGASSRGLTFAAYLSLAWVLGSWWAHSSLHQHHGFDLVPLLGIEYGFHVTMMIAGTILAIFFVKALSQKAELIGAGYKTQTKVTA